MSKSMTEAFVKAQFRALNAENNKERIGYMVAGIKDGKFYDHKTDTDYGVFNTDSPDTVFIPESDLELQRITGAKLATLTLNMTKFFDAYGANPTETAEGGEDKTELTPNESHRDEACVKSAEGEQPSESVDVDALIKAFAKAIKKGKAKKAQKIINKLGEAGAKVKKLKKELEKLESEG